MSTGHILVVSTNPAVDVEWQVTRLLPEEKNEILQERRWPGGKGVNVARWLTYMGSGVQLVLPLGGTHGREIALGLKAEGIPFRPVPIRGSTRANVVVTTAGGGQYRLNPTWPVLDAAELEALSSVVRREMKRCVALVLSGALVRGAPVDLYADWIRQARDAGLPVFLDCDGPAFRVAAVQGSLLVKPNVHELEQWTGRPLVGTDALVVAARELAEVTQGWVLVSRGAEGALMLGPRDGPVWSRPAGRARVRNTVGAGDALLAAVVHAFIQGVPPRQWLSSGVRLARMAVQLEPGKTFAGEPRRGAAQPSKGTP